MGINQAGDSSGNCRDCVVICKIILSSSFIMIDLSSKFCSTMARIQEIISSRPYHHIQHLGICPNVLFYRIRSFKQSGIAHHYASHSHRSHQSWLRNASNDWLEIHLWISDSLRDLLSNPFHAHPNESRQIREARSVQSGTLSGNQNSLLKSPSQHFTDHKHGEARR
jgi:hypothetical protein